MSIFSNIFNHSKSTITGVLTAIAAASAAGVTAAATQFGQSGQVTDYKPYAAAAVAAAIPAFIGAFSKDTPDPSPLSDAAQKTAQAIEQAGNDYASKKADEVIAKLQEQLNK